MRRFLFLSWEGLWSHFAAAFSLVPAATQTAFVRPKNREKNRESGLTQWYLTWRSPSRADPRARPRRERMSDDDHENEPTTTGRGNPSRATQFKPGQSGNPNGRPRGAKGFRSILYDACEENGVTPEGFMKKALAEEVKKALAGDEKANDRMLRRFEKHYSDDTE